LRGSDTQRSHYHYRDTEQIDWFPPIYKCRVNSVVQKIKMSGIIQKLEYDETKNVPKEVEMVDTLTAKLR